jgi:hypothetical protein
MSIVDKINAYLYAKNLTLDDYISQEVASLAKWSFRRQFLEEYESTGELRVSSLGKCPRQLAYGYHKFEPKGKEIDGRGRITFFMGDLSELLVTQLARLSGVRLLATGFNQITIEFEGLKGHPDGLLLGEDNKLRLFECKSFSDYGFKDFEKGEIDDSYRVQISCYMEALGLDECVMVGVNKNNGVLSEHIFSKDAKFVDMAKATLNQVKNSFTDTNEFGDKIEAKFPKHPYEPDEKTKLYPWQCLYCRWWGICLPNAEKVLVKNAYKLREKSNAKPIE